LSKEYQQKIGIASTIPVGGNIMAYVDGVTLGQFTQFDPDGLMTTSSSDTKVLTETKAIKNTLIACGAGLTKYAGINGGMIQQGGAIIELSTAVMLEQNGARDGIYLYMFHGKSILTFAGIYVYEGLGGLFLDYYDDAGTLVNCKVFPLVQFEKYYWHSLKVKYNIQRGEYSSVTWDGEEIPLTGLKGGVVATDNGSYALNWGIDFKVTDTTASDIYVDHVLAVAL